MCATRTGSCLTRLCLDTVFEDEKVVRGEKGNKRKGEREKKRQQEEKREGEAVEKGGEGKKELRAEERERDG